MREPFRASHLEGVYRGDFVQVLIRWVAGQHGDQQREGDFGFEAGEVSS
jgi:hypothetical protein